MVQVTCRFLYAQANWRLAVEQGLAVVPAINKVDLPQAGKRGMRRKSLKVVLAINVVDLLKQEREQRKGIPLKENSLRFCAPNCIGSANCFVNEESCVVRCFLGAIHGFLPTIDQAIW